MFKFIPEIRCRKWLQYFKKTLKIKTVSDAGGVYSDMGNDVSLKDIKP
jgi:hypothetical protein